MHFFYRYLGLHIWNYITVHMNACRRKIFKNMYLLLNVILPPLRTCKIQVKVTLIMEYHAALKHQYYVVHAGPLLPLSKLGC